jgi:hypothetical protein
MDNVDQFGERLIAFLARQEARLPTLFQCQRVDGESNQPSRFAVTVTGASLLVFWRFSGDVNEMHRPTERGGVVQGLALLAVVNRAISMWSPGLAVRRLSCKVSNPCLVRIQDTVVLTVRLKMCKGGHGRKRRAVVTVSGPRRSGGNVVRFMSKVVTLHQRTKTG